MPDDSSGKPDVAVLGIISKVGGDMTYKMFDTAQGQFCIDWDTCCHIIRSYHRSKLQLDYSKEQRESQVSTINPLSWEMPDLIMLTVDWDKVRSEAATAVLNSAHGMAFRAVFQKDGIDAMVRELQMMQRRTRTNNEAFQEKQRDVSRKASKEIEAPLRPSQNPRRSVSPR